MIQESMVDGTIPADDAEDDVDEDDKVSTNSLDKEQDEDVLPIEECIKTFFYRFDKQKFIRNEYQDSE